VGSRQYLRGRLTAAYSASGAGPGRCAGASSPAPASRSISVKASQTGPGTVRSPASHLRTELCSYCDMPLDPDGVPLILWNLAGWVAEFCDACVEHWFGVTGA
jgi:hypothetical protein